MNVEEMKARAAELEAGIADALHAKEVLLADVEPIKAHVAVLRAELEPLQAAIAKLKDLDEATLALLQGATL